MWHSEPLFYGFPTGLGWEIAGALSMKQQFHYFATCPRGLEAILAAELGRLGAQTIESTAGGVHFSGPWTLMMRVNLHSRVASRVMWRLIERTYRDEEDIYKAARSMDWPALFEVACTIKVNVSALKSPLRSLDFAGLRVKDAICDSFRTSGGERPSVDTAQPDMRIHLFLTDRMLTLYLDTSGEALFKRGYREAAGEAPLRENLAAGLLHLSGWHPGIALCDPMCGSGTLLIEAAMWALNWPPGRFRQFGFRKIRGFDLAQWQQIQHEAADAEKSAILLPIFGSDSSPDAILNAHDNLAAAGLSECVSLSTIDVLDCPAPAASGVLVSNPPYGIRLDEQAALATFYPLLGSALKQRFADWNAYFLTADLRLAKLIRLSTSRRTVLFNGALECRLFEYKLVAGSNRQ
jgi:putative N6-adenine-specific DNA methylase